jgi:hypothetical protein
MNPDKVRRLPALMEYLRTAQGFEPAGRPGWLLPLFAAGVAFAAGFGLTAGLIGALAGSAIGLAAAFIGGFGTYEFQVARARRLASQPSLGELKRRLWAIGLRGRAHKEMDLGAAVALEGCAREWARIRRILVSPAWTSSGLGESWQQMRENAASRAKEAMDEAILLCQGGIGRAQTGRTSKFKEAFAEMLDGDLDDALEAFVKGSDDRDEDGLAQPGGPVARDAIGTVRAIGQNLHLLADELAEAEQMLPHAGTEQVSVRAELEKTLSELRELKKAEQELEASLRSMPARPEC